MATCCSSSDEMLVEQPLDLAAGKLTGTPREVVGPISYTTGLGYAPISVASNGLLAYHAAVLMRARRRSWSGSIVRASGIGSIGADAGLGRDMTYNERLSLDGHSAVVSVVPLGDAPMSG